MYLNPRNDLFYNAVKHSEIYVDKTMLIAYTNTKLFGSNKYICVSRPRRFGKSMAENMLAAYYSRGCDSRELFQNLKIAGDPSFEKHLNKYNVIQLNIAALTDQCENMDQLLNTIRQRVTHEIKREFSGLDFIDPDNLILSIEDIYSQTNIPFVFIIDEWDCIFREFYRDTESQNKYLKFLRNLLKDHAYVAFAYMTGILPIHKYGEHSALNMFREISIIDPEPLQEFTGFTSEEVKDLCTQYGMNFNTTKEWYNGYNVGGVSIYNPNSVVEAIDRGVFRSYWTQTETYEALKEYIQEDTFGLNETVTRLVAGERIHVNTRSFQNDMNPRNAQETLTLLIHLGYLTYDFDEKECWIPNKEVRDEFATCIETDATMSKVNDAIQQSKELLNRTINMDSGAVAAAIDKIHRDVFPPAKYNSEDSLCCVVRLAYYFAQNYYDIECEKQGGLGFADIAFTPHPHRADKYPAMLVELKWNKDAETALDQIKSRHYAECFKDYSGEIILVGITYDKATKKHECQIERI